MEALETVLNLMRLRELQSVARRVALVGVDRRKFADLVEALFEADLTPEHLFEGLAVGRLREIASSIPLPSIRRKHADLVADLTAFIVAGVRRRIDFDEATSLSLVNLSERGVRAFSWPSSPVRVRWGKTDFEAANCVVRVRDVTLELVVHGGPVDPGWIRDGTSADAQIVFDDGRVIRARRMFQTRVSFSPHDAAASESVFSASEWELTTDEKPVLWALELIDLDSTRGNLTCRREWSVGDRTQVESTMSHVLLEGRRNQIILRSTVQGVARCHLVVLGSKSPTPADLRDDFEILQFLFGRRIGTTGPFLGLDAGGHLCGAAAWPMSAPHPEKAGTTPAVPLREAGAISEFFGLLSRAMAEKRDTLALYVPLTTYIEAAADRYVDHKYMRLALGIGAFARTLDRVRDVPGNESQAAGNWGRWIDEQREALEAMLGPKATPMLRRLHPSLASRVSAHLEAFERPLTPAAVEELTQIEAVFDSGLLRSPGEHAPVQESTRRVALLRQVLAGLVAGAVGYRGPIEAREEPRTPEAFAHPADGALPNAGITVRHYIVRVEGPPTLDEPDWPELRVPELASPLLVRINEFADRLKSRTNGRLLARLRWIPSSGKGVARYELAAGVASQPATQIRLLTVELDPQTPDLLFVTDALEQAHVLSGERELDSFLRNLGAADDTAVRLEGLLSVAYMLGG